MHAVESECFNSPVTEPAVRLNPAPIPRRKFPNLASVRLSVIDSTCSCERQHKIDAVEYDNASSYASAFQKFFCGPIRALESAVDRAAPPMLL
jgi:hypothetical protein